MSKNIQTIKDFTKWLSSLSGRLMLYRGLADKNWKVEASASRRIEDYSDSSIFRKYVLDLLEDARRSGLGLDAKICDLELLANLQHHGAATCLIDFTQSPFTALWFACKDEPKEDGKVIGMRTDNTKLFNIVNSEQQEKKIGTFLDKESLWKWEPRDINNRIIAQQSTFVFGKQNIEASCYDAVIIEQTNKAKFIKALKENYNISEVTLFRDLSGFSLANAHNKIYTKYTKEDYFSFAVSAYERRDFEGVERFCSEIIKRDNNDPDAYHNRGIARGNLGNQRGAIEDYDKAIELNPGSAETYNNRGIAKSKLNDARGAIEDYDKAIELNPNTATVYNNRGIARGKLGDQRGAIEDYDKAIELDPGSAETYNNRGNAKSKLNDARGAIEDYDKAIELNPNTATVYNNRGIVRGKLGDHKDAKEDFTKAAEIESINDPGNVSEI